MIELFPLPPFYSLAAASNLYPWSPSPVDMPPYPLMRQEGCRKLDPGEFISSTWGGISEFHSGQVFSLKGKILLHKKLWTHFPTTATFSHHPFQSPQGNFLHLYSENLGDKPQRLWLLGFFPLSPSHALLLAICENYHLSHPASLGLLLQVSGSWLL